MPDELHRVLPSSLPAPCCCCCCCCCVKVGPVAPHLRSREQNSWAQPWAVTLLELHPVRSPWSGPGTRGPPSITYRRNLDKLDFVWGFMPVLLYSSFTNSFSLSVAQHSIVNRGDKYYSIKCPGDPRELDPTTPALHCCPSSLGHRRSESSNKLQTSHGLRTCPGLLQLSPWSVTYFKMGISKDEDR